MAGNGETPRENAEAPGLVEAEGAVTSAGWMGGSREPCAGRCVTGAELFNRGRQPDLEKPQTWNPANQCPELTLLPASHRHLAKPNWAPQSRRSPSCVPDGSACSAEPGGSDGAAGSHGLIAKLGGSPVGAGLEQQGPTVMLGEPRGRQRTSTIKEVIQKDHLRTTGTQTERPLGGEGTSLVAEFKCPVIKPRRSHIFTEIFLACKNQIHLAISLDAAG